MQKIIGGGGMHVDSIGTFIYDGYDDGTLGFVDISTVLEQPNTDAPPIPPQNLTVTGNGDVSVDMSWDASLIGDLAGYKVYYDTDTAGYPYAHSIDAGTNITYTLASLSRFNTYYVAVTTFDTDGNESWYSNELVLYSGCFGTNACNYDSNASFGGACLFPEENYDCNGDCLVEIDCDEVCGGITVEDCAGVCGGNTSQEVCDECPSLVFDCAGVCDGSDVVGGCDNVCGSTAVVDACGECGGDGPEEGLDCYGNQLSLFNGLIPEDFNLHSIYPNPFNPVTNIIYGLPEHVNVQILVYDLSGKQIVTLINQFQTPGYHSVSWNADNHPSGVYFVKIVAGDYINTQKLMLVK